MTPEPTSALFLGSVALHRPVTELFAREIYPVPERVRESADYRAMFGLMGVRRSEQRAAIVDFAS